MQISAAEARVRMLAQRVEDSGFKYARPPTEPLGGPRRPPERPTRREPVGGELPWNRGTVLPARASASSSRAHGMWDATGSFAGRPGWVADPADLGGAGSTMVGNASAANESTASARTSPPSQRPPPRADLPRMSEPMRVEPPRSWGTPSVGMAGGNVTARGAGAAASARPTSARRGPARPGSAQPGSARGGAGGAAGHGGKSLADYQVLAAACARVGRHRQEALAHFSAGVLLEGGGTIGKATASYGKMVGAARRAGDVIVQAVGHNHLGCCLQLLGEFERAKQQAEAHLALDLDGGSRYIAHLNLGLAQAALGDFDGAAHSQQLALRYAVRSSSLEGESVASANLAVATAHESVNDVATARACLERHLELSSSMRDGRGASSEAYQILGEIERDQGNRAQAGDCFRSAMAAARDTRREGEVNASKLALGLMDGSAMFDEWVARQSAAAAAAAADGGDGDGGGGGDAFRGGREEEAEAMLATLSMGQQETVSWSP